MRNQQTRFTLAELSKMVSKGFTLVELLVVITIIVVLLSLLAPALDKAIYQAELAVCGANQYALGGGLIQYTANYKGQWPVRATQDGAIWWLAFHTNPPQANGDNRPQIRDYVPINKVFTDPLAGRVDLLNCVAGSSVYAPYALFYGIKGFLPGEKPMRRMGDRFTWTSADFGNSQVAFNVLAGDLCVDNYPTGSVALTAHPDFDEVLLNRALQDAPHPNVTGGGLTNVPGTALGNQWTFARWERYASPQPRGAMDMNFLFDDLSVRRYNSVAFNEWEGGGPIVRIPFYQVLASGWPNNAQLAPKQ